MIGYVLLTLQIFQRLILRIGDMKPNLKYQSMQQRIHLKFI